MRKLMLLLLSVFALVSAVSAEEYFVVVDGYSQDEIQSKLDSASWDAYTPQITKVEGNKIYFASEKDMARFLMPVNICAYSYTFMFPPDKLMLQNEYSLVTMVHRGTLSEYFFNNASNGILYACIGTDWSDKDYVRIIQENTICLSRGKNSLVFIDSPYLLEGNFSVSISARSGHFTNVVLLTPGLLSGSRGTIYHFRLCPYYLTIYAEPGAQVYVDGELVGTTDNGGYAKLLIETGEPQLKITKDGFWDYTTTLNIQNDTELHINLVPKTSIIGLDYNLTERTYPDSIGTMDIKLTPIVDAYGITLKLSGVDIVSVSYNGNNLEEVNGKYILGDLSKGVQTELLIKFKTPSSFGEKSFTANIEATDVEGNAYSQNEIIEYNVEELPFLVELPAWKLEDNTVRITDTSGTSYGVSLVLYDKDGNEVWSDSQSMLEYGECDFTISITSPGDYVLEISGAGAKTYKEIHLIEPVSLITKTVNAGKGEVATVKFSITNPSNSVKYYYATLYCELMNLSANKTLKQFAVSPNENKTVELSFKVPSDAQYDSYSLNLNVYDSNTKELLYSNIVVLDIVESSLIPVGGGDSTVLILAAVVGVLLITGIGIYFVRKK
jgi:hypothetical protein